MAKKDQKPTISSEKMTIPSKSVDVKCQAFELRDPRPGGLSYMLDAAMERVWRNCLYPQKISFSDYYRMYARNNIAARVIETFPDYSWSVVPFVTDSRGSDSRFSKAVASLLAAQYKMQDGISQSLLASMKQLDVLGGIGGEALLVFGFADGLKLDMPVAARKDMKISWIKILHNGQFEIEKRDTDEASATFGDVLLYKTKDFVSDIDLNFSSQIAANVSIHASRCVHFKESSGLAYGTSRIQKCYNQLLDITKLSGASAEVYWLGAFSGLSIETDPASSLSDESYTKMQLETKKYFDGLARALIFEGATAKLLMPAIVSPKEHFDLQITMISIATGIPRRFLTGAEAAKLASQQDTLNWMERVTNRREMFVGPKVVSPVVQRCIDAGVITAPAEGTFTVGWPRIQSIALNERADAARNMTAAWLSYAESGLTKVIPFRVYLLYACGYSETEADDISEKADLENWDAVVQISKQNGTATTTSSSASTTSSLAMNAFERRLENIETCVDEHLEYVLPNSSVPKNTEVSECSLRDDLRRKKGQN